MSWNIPVNAEKFINNKDFWFVVKVGIASGAVYYVKEQGVWKDSTESLKVYDQIGVALQPYAVQVKQQLPIELPTLPEKDKLSTLTKEGWNKAVSATFGFLKDLPCTTRSLVKKGWEQLEVDKFITSSPPATSTAATKK